MSARDKRSQKSNSKKSGLTHTGHLTHEELQKVHDQNPMSVLAVGMDGKISYANEAILTSADLKENTILGQSLFSLYEDILPGRPNEARLKQLEEINDQEFAVNMQPGKRWVCISSKVHKDTKGVVQTYLFIRDISGLKKREHLSSYLNRAAAALATARDTSRALSLIADLIVPKFASWFTIDRIKENRLELLLLKHEDPAKIEWAYEYRRRYPADLNGNTGPAVVVKSGEPSLVPDITEDMLDLVVADPVQREEVSKIGLRSVIIVPMFTGSRVSGLVNFISSAADRHFDETDLEFAQNFTNLIGLALENARLNEEASGELALRRQSEKQFRFLTDAIPHKLWTSDPDGRATYYNEQWYDYTQIKDFEALRGKIWDIIHPEDRAIAVEAYPNAIKNRVPVEFEHRLRRHDEVYRWHLSRILPHINEQGETILWLGTSTDIHEQKLAELEMATLNEELAAANDELLSMNEEAASNNEELAAANEELTAMNEEVAATNEELAAANEELAATNEELTKTQANLQQSERLFRSIALNIPGSLIIVIDKNQRYIAIEGDLMEKLGYSRQHYEGTHPSEISAERYETFGPLNERMLAGERFSIEWKAETGEYYMVHFVPLKNGGQETQAGLIITLDITVIKQAEEKSAKLAAIVETSDDAIISKTLESVVTSWNAAAERMFGYAAEEMIGEPIYKIIPQDRRDEELHILARLKTGERVDHFETKRLTKDGRLLDVSLTISPLMDKQDRITGLSKIVRDITEKKQQEQRKNDFIGMVSHELKTPLTSLTAIIQLAARKLKQSEEAFLADAMEKANYQARRMTNMINGFLSVSRLEAGKLEIEKRPFDLDKLLREILEETRLTVTSHSFSLEECDGISVNADQDKISSVISNLINNAVKYSPKGKLIDIRCSMSRDGVVVSVKDEGMGIKPEYLEHIFDRYYRVEANHTQHISGFGIGLYLSAEIVKLHGGAIWAESEPGNGSVFYFSLPLG